MGTALEDNSDRCGTHRLPLTAPNALYRMVEA